MKKDKINLIFMAIIFFGMAIFCIAKPDSEISISERRKLKQKPALTMETVFEKKGGTSFMDEFELYAKDQFPAREAFRNINAIAGRYVLGRKEINGLYTSNVTGDGSFGLFSSGGKSYIAKLEDGIHEKDVDWSVSRITYIIDRYLEIDSDTQSARGNNLVPDRKIIMAMVPDKNYYLAREKGYPYLDASEFGQLIAERLGERVHFLNLADQLSIENYYRTDTHWKQETLIPVAENLLEKLKDAPGEGTDKQEVKSSQDRESGQYTKRNYTVLKLTDDFYGVYYGQAALPMKGEELSYLTWEGMDDLLVQCFDSGKAVPMEMYDLSKADSLDPYETFLGGSKALITIENPAGEGELVVFRDSFGSSIAPLLTEGYQKVTLVDIRYISPAMVGKFVEFEKADVLFLYSTMILNNSLGQFLK